jgi:hypothetical protein
MIRSLPRKVARVARLTSDTRRFLRTPVSLSQAVEVIQTRLVTREDRFLRMAERAIYDHPRSPYLQLLHAAGCELGDLKALVSKEGLEASLSRLAEAGVFVTFDEFKGRKDAIRGSRRFAFAEEEFDNPEIVPHFEARSGGTRSAGTRVKIGFPFMTDLALSTAYTLDVHGLSDFEHVIWSQALAPVVLYAKLGRPPLAWFYPLRPLSLKTQVVSRYLALIGRLFGHSIPVPAFLDVQDPGGMALWLARHLRRGRSICVTAYASSAVRVAAAAYAKGLPLHGVCFITLGEPFTDAKRRIVEASGARALVRYALTEAGIIGYGCRSPTASDDLHFLSESYGMVQHSRRVGDSDLTVDAFLFTSLLCSAPKILLNVESGDCGLVERRDCDGGFSQLGLRDHIAEIRSFEKLSGEGMTFVRSDLLRVVEEVLPGQFGGNSTDYQVIEEERDDGILRLLLIVSPDIGRVDEEKLRETFLEELARGGGLARFGARIWERAGTVRIERRTPVATKAGKILPFHLHRASLKSLDSPPRGPTSQR